MRAAFASSSRENERGSTLVEVLVGVAILALLGIGALSAVGGSLRVGTRIRARARESAMLLQLDDRVRDAARRVRAPYWEWGTPVEADGRRLRVRYLDGEPGAALEIAFDGDTLTLDDGTGAFRCGGFSRAAVLAALDPEGRPFGIRLELERGEARRIIIIARFGGVPVEGRWLR